MKSNIALIVLIILIFFGGFFVHKITTRPEVITRTKTVVKVRTKGFDSTYVSNLDKNLKSLKADNKKLLLALKNKPKVESLLVVDSILIHDTVFVLYSSNFKVGTDTLSCSGNVHFDMSRFYFSNIEFQYPHRIITVHETKIEKEINWIYVGAAFFGGMLAEGIIK